MPRANRPRLARRCSITEGDCYDGLEKTVARRNIEQMNYQRLPGPRPGLVQRVATAIVTTAVLIGLFFAGIIAWIVMAGIVLVGGLALSIWLWRKRRQFESIHAEVMREATLRRRGAGADEAGQTADTIEGDYVVIDEREPRSNR